MGCRLLRRRDSFPGQYAALTPLRGSIGGISRPLRILGETRGRYGRIPRAPPRVIGTAASAHVRRRQCRLVQYQLDVIVLDARIDRPLVIAPAVTPIPSSSSSSQRRDVIPLRIQLARRRLLRGRIVAVLVGGDAPHGRTVVTPVASSSFGPLDARSFAERLANDFVGVAYRRDSSQSSSSFSSWSSHGGNGGTAVIAIVLSRQVRLRDIRQRRGGIRCRIRLRIGRRIGHRVRPNSRPNSRPDGRPAVGGDVIGTEHAVVRNGQKIVDVFEDAAFVEQRVHEVIVLLVAIVVVRSIVVGAVNIEVGMAKVGRIHRRVQPSRIGTDIGTVGSIVIAAAAHRRSPRKIGRETGRQIGNVALVTRHAAEYPIDQHGLVAAAASSFAGGIGGTGGASSRSAGIAWGGGWLQGMTRRG
mmetsp:Transcript_5562/g.12104  ORF Transcript_5562/g.12104 Transcript_5562/m.12104 type:complete len:414 (+) Transcript_5562:288-1529(+)